MKLLIVIDMQNDFIDGALGTAEAVKIVPAVADKLAARRSEGWKVLFTRDTHGADYLDTQEGRRLSVPHCIWGTEGWQITSSLEVGEAALVDKPTFGSLDLAEAAANLGEPEEIELVGLCTDICVISNAMILKARFPEARVLVDAACCAGVTPESHENALKAMGVCQVDVI
ncbi:cysteine hydrolase family protein [Pseudoflavonifractor phocaeensis]|mgnify:FL=1|uniref:cysteine hydrolase family protein n=1 Tax=Pseudoflavonifractor phocaeensis TaxID=1870988 RepID=UPI00210CAD91|nr:isochorismatase family cysteine hydrolase [Pseudoflavonifractor phocaeensis]MCQ4866017.1 cysteine hydrolase [Pseudoflavonifractor phocaeensis]